MEKLFRIKLYEPEDLILGLENNILPFPFWIQTFFFILWRRIFQFEGKPNLISSNFKATNGWNLPVCSLWNILNLQVMGECNMETLTQMNSLIVGLGKIRRNCFLYIQRLIRGHPVSNVLYTIYSRWMNEETNNADWKVNLAHQGLQCPSGIHIYRSLKCLFL